MEFCRLQRKKDFFWTLNTCQLVKERYLAKLYGIFDPAEIEVVGYAHPVRAIVRLYNYPRNYDSG